MSDSVVVTPHKWRTGSYLVSCGTVEADVNLELGFYSLEAIEGRLLFEQDENKRANLQKIRDHVVQMIPDEFEY
ncbi:MAG: hypothetical protein OXI72_09255 [Gemmatimonadota bacterium]|nr:hypothetical protein [Gemmatimonadota bacterium]